MIEVALKYISVAGIGYIFIPFRGILNGFIMGTGHTKIVFFSSTIATIAEIVILKALENTGMYTLTKLGIAVSLYCILKMIIDGLYYLSGKWKTQTINTYC